METEIYLPELIIQRILSFLVEKEAAQTSILSKLWYNAWSTRPILTFQDSNFRRFDEFQSVARKTLLRYKKLQLKVDNFILLMDHHGTNNFLADELIIDSLQLGLNNLSFAFTRPNLKYVLPAEVFTARSLNGLSICGCKLNLPIDMKVLCSSLVTLYFYYVYIENDMISYILQGCPLLKVLDVFGCWGPTKINVSNKLDKLQFFRVMPAVNYPYSNIIEFEESAIGPVIDNRIEVPKFRNLSVMTLGKARIDVAFFKNFSSWFPSIEDLTLCTVDSCESIQISSHSLKFLTLSLLNYLKKAELVVPNIRVFTFYGWHIPKLSFSTASENWESDIEFLQQNVLGVSSVELKLFLMELKRSKISLSIILETLTWETLPEEVHRFPIPVVENLKVKTIGSSSNDFYHLSALFLSCRPKIITQSFWNSLEPRDYIVLRHLYDTWIHHRRDPYSLPWIDDLKEIQVEFGKNIHKELSLYFWKNLRQSSIIPQKGNGVQFHLKWGRA